MTPKSADLSQNWDDTLRVAETAALPSKYTLLDTVSYFVVICDHTLTIHFFETY